MLGAAVCCSARADCFDSAAQRHGVNAAVLRAIASAESDMRPNAVSNSHSTRTGTRDIGLMQINTGWLPRLSKFGITETGLLDACTNIEVGAWILADLFVKHGPTWEGVGAYNAACVQLRGDDCRRARASYTWRVYRRLNRGSGFPASIPIDTPAALVTAASATPDTSAASVRLVPSPGLLAVNGLVDGQVDAVSSSSMRVVEVLE